MPPGEIYDVVSLGTVENSVAEVGCAGNRRLVIHYLSLDDKVSRAGRYS